VLYRDMDVAEGPFKRMLAEDGIGASGVEQ
jgi:hypothetical protein